MTTVGRSRGAQTEAALPPQSARVTIRDVARLAHVSCGTVSNVLNRPSVVAPATRERVLEVIETTGFIRSAAARQLRSGQSRTVGVVLLDIANPFFTEVVRGIEHVLTENSHVLMLCSSDESSEREEHYLRLLAEFRVDGVLITPAAQELDKISDLIDQGIPTVLLDRGWGRDDLCSVTVDDVRGGELAATHLVSLGHEVIAFVNGSLTIRQCVDRREGVRRVWRRERRRRPIALHEFSVSALTAEHGEYAAAQLLHMNPLPTGVICANDLLAMGVLRKFASSGITVPNEISVVGYDDITFASMCSPALTSVRQPKYELGTTAARLLLEEVLRVGHDHQVVRFEPELITRASTIPVWKGQAEMSP